MNLVLTVDNSPEESFRAQSMGYPHQVQNEEVRGGPRLAPDRAALGCAAQPEKSLRAAWPIRGVTSGRIQGVLCNAQGKALGVASALGFIGSDIPIST